MANERRLIDMDETINQLRDYADRKHANGHNDAANGILNAVSYIRNNITRVDAVEVVFCKDCEHYDGRICNFFSEWPDQYSTGHTVYMEPDDFCSYGERRCEE